MSNEFIEPELDNWVSDTRQRRSFINRPVPLFFMLAIAIALTVMIFPKANLYFLEVKDCGDITYRPGQKPAERIPLVHDTFCTMTGVVSDLRVFSAGTEHLDNANPKDGPLPTQEEFKDVRYFTKLSGDKVFVILDAAADDVYAHRKRHRGDGLFGFAVDHVGRIINPTTEGGKYRRIGNFLRSHFALSATDEMRLLDTTDTPEDHLFHLIAFVLAALGVLLASFGLLRLWRRRMNQASA